MVVDGGMYGVEWQLSIRNWLLSASLPAFVVRACTGNNNLMANEMPQSKGVCWVNYKWSTRRDDNDRGLQLWL